MTLEEIESVIADHQEEIKVLRQIALSLPQVRAMPGEWVRAWLEAHGASKNQAQNEILAVLNERRAAAGDSPVGTCSRRQS